MKTSKPSFVIGFFVCSFLILTVFPYGSWSMIQIFRSVLGRQILSSPLDQIEMELWRNWEVKSQENKHKKSILPFPVLTDISQIDKIDISRPFLIKNLSSYDMLTLSHLMTPPMSETEIDYFIDARKKNTVPDSKGKVGEIVKKIVQGGPEKIGTQMIVQHFPQIVIDFVDKNPWLRVVFGNQRVDTWRSLNQIVTFPIFVSRGRAASIEQPIGTTRTDLHCEPISNVVVQTAGSKKWTLVEPQYSHLLRPTVSPDGRAYFYSSLDPFDPLALEKIPHYEVITEEGDVIYVPTWTWHRIDYTPDVVAVSLSIFQFIPGDFLSRHPIFAVALIPNLIKEALGIKMQ